MIISATILFDLFDLNDSIQTKMIKKMFDAIMNFKQSIVVCKALIIVCFGIDNILQDDFTVI